MTESASEQPGRHAAPDDDPNSDPPPSAGAGGEHAGNGGDDVQEPESEQTDGPDLDGDGNVDGRHEAFDDDPDSDPEPVAGAGGKHSSEDADNDTDIDTTDDTDEEGGVAQPGADPADAEQIAEERTERLDPENRPDDVEVDNTDKDFDAVKGMFTDSEEYENAEEQYAEPGSDEDAT